MRHLFTCIILFATSIFSIGAQNTWSKNEIEAYKSISDKIRFERDRDQVYDASSSTFVGTWYMLPNYEINKYQAVFTFRSGGTLTIEEDTGDKRMLKVENYKWKKDGEKLNMIFVSSKYIRNPKYDAEYNKLSNRLKAEFNKELQDKNDFENGWRIGAKLAGQSDDVKQTILYLTKDVFLLSGEGRPAVKKDYLASQAEKEAKAEEEKEAQTEEEKAFNAKLEYLDQLLKYKETPSLMPKL